MNRQTLTFRQAVCVITIFICGSSVILGGFTDLEQDSWIALVASQIFVIPMALIYCRIMWLFPEKNIYQISQFIFGKIIGRIITVLMIWYAIHLAALVLRNFSEFMQIVAMTETPQLALMIIILIVAVYMAKSGVVTLGKWAVIVLPIFVLTVLATFLLLLNQMDFTNLMPVMNHSTKAILNGAYKIFTFPFMETVLFLGIADSVRRQENPFKIFGWSIFLGVVLLVGVLIRNILSLGPALMESEYFPSYISARIISVSDFLVRIEGTISLNFILTGLTKITVCLIAACKGIAQLLGTEDYKHFVMPVGLCVLALCSIIYDSSMQMINFLGVYSVYVIAFQIIFPVLLWVGGEIKNHRKQAKIPEKL